MPKPHESWHRYEGVVRHPSAYRSLGALADQAVGSWLIRPAQRRRSSGLVWAHTSGPDARHLRDAHSAACLVVAVGSSPGCSCSISVAAPCHDRQTGVSHPIRKRRRHESRGSRRSPRCGGRHKPSQRGWAGAFSKIRSDLGVQGLHGDSTRVLEVAGVAILELARHL